MSFLCRSSTLTDSTSTLSDTSCIEEELLYGSYYYDFDSACYSTTSQVDLTMSYIEVCVYQLNMCAAYAVFIYL